MGSQLAPRHSANRLLHGISWTALLLLYVSSIDLAQAWTPRPNHAIRSRRIIWRQRPHLPCTFSNQFSNSVLSLESTSDSEVDTQQEGSFSIGIEEPAESVNGEANTRIIPAASTGKYQLAAAFTALDETDQYDAVLTGLCAKILDGSAEGSSKVNLEDPKALLVEMNQRKIAASPRSLMALIDATVKVQNDKVMSDMLSLAVKNPKGVTQYGILQSSILQLPSSPSQQVTCPDGARKTRAERLEGLPDVPSDERGTEVSSALAFSGVVALCTVANILGMDDITPYTNIIVFLLTTVGVVDNFYDVVRVGSNTAISSLNTTDATKENLKLPEKDSLPFGLGKGEVTGTVVRGLARLLSVDTERECQCEAAALYAAYTLGLPCFAFRPNSLEATYLIATSIQDADATESPSTLDRLLSSEGILKVLIWLMAPVAMENSKHAQLICSDPQQAAGLLQRLEDNVGKNNIDADSLWWVDDEQERHDLLKWAYHEADLLLRDNRKDILEISQRLTGGAATIADCVAVAEKW